MRQLNEIIVHTTATRPEWMDGQGIVAKIAEIDRWHTSPPRNWRAIGYHYVIDRDGVIGVGRKVEEQGAHVRGRNSDTIGIALVGGFGGSENDSFEDHYTPEQDRSLRELIAMLKSDHASIKKLSGHNEYAAKACPCFDVRRWYDRKPPARTSMTQSKTAQAVGVGTVATVAPVVTAVGELDSTAQIVLIAGACVTLMVLAFVLRERLKKWRRGIR